MALMFNRVFSKRRKSYFVACNNAIIIAIMSLQSFFLVATVKKKNSHVSSTND